LTDEFVVLFTGAWHVPNRAALQDMRNWAHDEASAKTGRLYVVAGSVGQRAERSEGLVVTGALPDLSAWFHAADCCVNPVDTGSGANVKILEYMALGLPVVSTAFGARGNDLVDGEHVLIRPLKELPAAIQELQDDPAMAARLAAAGRTYIEQERAWASIAQKRRALLEDRLLG